MVSIDWNETETCLEACSSLSSRWVTPSTDTCLTLRALLCSAYDLGNGCESLLVVVNPPAVVVNPLNSLTHPSQQGRERKWN